MATVATVLDRIETRADAEGITVLLGGNGQLLPSQVGEAVDLPPRLFLDFPDVRSGVPSVTLVELGPVERVRVAPNSQTPLVTRVVLDLRRPAAYRIETPETNEHELRVIVLNDEALPAEPVIPAVPEVPEPAIRAVPEVPEVVDLASTAGPPDVTDVVAAARSQRLPANSVFVNPMAALRVMEATEAVEAVEALQSVESLELATAAAAEAQPPGLLLQKRKSKVFRLQRRVRRRHRSPRRPWCR